MALENLILGTLYCKDVVCFLPSGFGSSAKSAKLPYNILLVKDILLAFSAAEATLIAVSKMHQCATHHKRRSARFKDQET